MKSGINRCPLQPKLLQNTLSDQIGMHKKRGDGTFLLESRQYLYRRINEDDKRGLEP
jgi:hypothetical protein